MLKKISVLIVFFSLITGLTIFGVHSFSNKQVILSASWTDQQKNIHEAVKNADLVLIGKVTGTNTFKVHQAVFTDYKTNVLNVSKKNKDFQENGFSVQLTGGDFEGVSYRIEEQPLLSENKTYLFLLKKVWPNDPNSNVWAPIGGYQGVIEISGDQSKYKGLKFNRSNALEDDLVNKDILKEIGPDIKVN